MRYLALTALFTSALATSYAPLPFNITDYAFESDPQGPVHVTFTLGTYTNSAIYCTKSRGARQYDGVPSGASPCTWIDGPVDGNFQYWFFLAPAAEPSDLNPSGYTVGVYHQAAPGKTLWGNGRMLIPNKCASSTEGYLKCTQVGDLYSDTFYPRLL
ncbi:hypothetical protein CFE70_009687 [Pyrenophora teres f. teres 0-1]|uniref:AA1-like domain-containing protein n=2 Tax=Pyrenophora teres f. teres TaxID=97479 RepID=E3RF74_PYRTT|nr:hypothetical protein PTT_05758 [Pyrenophora teres f. teres 0-1]KAE8827099.1 hypothetical protein HRS9139_08271 [Pyrenophora teres f. teres]KAE8832617.1 hypothetical protein PTNB85_07009 [Pyrenophora teres f. teres]KAE8836774.1 hypothetical protein HRS9122_06929 [Pyrenophora teres f. teres]KAE8856278.1 hypothetical protein PTNB29_09117 [Pyrenophora teres f. teres]